MIELLVLYFVLVLLLIFKFWLIIRDVFLKYYKYKILLKIDKNCEYVFLR